MSLQNKEEYGLTQRQGGRVLENRVWSSLYGPASQTPQKGSQLSSGKRQSGDLDPSPILLTGPMPLPLRASVSPSVKGAADDIGHKACCEQHMRSWGKLLQMEMRHTSIIPATINRGKYVCPAHAKVWGGKDRARQPGEHLLQPP